MLTRCWRSIEQVQDLALDRDVERRHGLVADDEVRVERQRAGDADALALAAGELVRVATDVARVEADALERARATVLVALLARRCRGPCEASPMMLPTVMRGLRLRTGPGRRSASWRRSGFSCAGASDARRSSRSPLNGPRPPVGRDQAEDRSGRRSSCRSRTRRPGRASRRAGRRS